MRRYLDGFVANFDYAAYVRRDPLQFSLRFTDARDQEVVGFIASCLAYGRVERVLQSVQKVLDRMGPSPSGFVRDFDPTVFAGFLHRMTAEVEIAALCLALGDVLHAYGSLEAVFAEVHSEDALTIRDGLSFLVSEVRSRATEHALSMGRRRDAAWHRRRVRFLLPGPAEGGACKRMNLWLRWMVRTSVPDRGIWKAARPSQLVIPLDTHIVRLSQYLGFTTRATPDWKMAEEVTAALRLLDPVDPMKYDFALCHLGIHGDCRRQRDAQVCPHCPIERACRL